MQKMIDVFNSGDVSNVGLFVSKNYIDHQGLRGIEIKGRGGFRQVVNAARSGIKDLKVKIEEMTCEDDKVTVRLTWSGFDTERNPVKRETTDTVRFENGQAVEHWGSKSHA